MNDATRTQVQESLTWIVVSGAVVWATLRITIEVGVWLVRKQSEDIRGKR